MVFSFKPVFVLFFSNSSIFFDERFGTSLVVGPSVKGNYYICTPHPHQRSTLRTVKVENVRFLEFFTGCGLNLLT